MADYNALRLKHHGDAAKLDEILQMECRDKCARKLPLALESQAFRFPSTAVAEMATAESVAEVHASLIDPGQRVLDMTFGLGIDTFAFARRGAHVTACELDLSTYETGRHNAAALFPNADIKLYHADSTAFLAETADTFDAIFVDPARRDRTGRHFALRDCAPDITACLPMLLARCKRLIVKASPMIDIAAAKAELGVTDMRVSIVGTVRECKEVLLEIPGDLADTPLPDETRCITVGHGEWRFNPSETLPPKVSPEMPEPGCCLLEPYPALMKAGASRSLGILPGIHAFHPNTHLFWSGAPLPDFPGETFIIERILPFGKQAVKTIAADYPKINVAVRNFPLTAPELVKKLKIREGGTLRLFGLTHTPSDKYLIIASIPSQF